MALAQQPAATTSLLLSLTPMFVAVTATFALGEIPVGRQLLGVGMVALGAALFFSGDLWATTTGMVAASIGLAADVASSLLGRSVDRTARLSPTLVTAVSMTVGAVVLVAAGLIAEGWPSVSPRAWLLIAWLALVNTALAITLWNLSLRRLSALGSASINNTMLVQIALLAWLFLGEAPGLAGMLGIVVVSARVLLTQLRTSRPAGT